MSTREIIDTLNEERFIVFPFMLSSDYSVPCEVWFFVGHIFDVIGIIDSSKSRQLNNILIFKENIREITGLYFGDFEQQY